MEDRKQNNSKMSHSKNQQSGSKAAVQGKKKILKDIEKAGGEEVVHQMQKLCDDSIKPTAVADTLFTATGTSFCNETLKTVPMVSLGKVEQSGPGSNCQPQTPLIPSSYPKIPVHHIQRMDLYLTAYHNFLSRWVPNLEFNYSDPGKITGSGLGILASFIKVAFSDQYYTVRKAYLGVRGQIFHDLEIEQGADLTKETNTNTNTNTNIPEALLLLEYDQYGPDEFNEHVDAVFANLGERQLLDISGHRGTGYFLIWNDTEKKTLVALPTIGSFGHFLPEPGLSLVKEFGWPYFRDTEIIGFQIGHLRRVHVETPEGAWEDWKLRGPIYLEVTEQTTDAVGDYQSCAYDDTMVMRLKVDDSFFPGIIFGQVG